jgi:hypothetical protein
MDATTLEAGYWRAYRNFYRWRSIWAGAATQDALRGRLRHLAYAGGWKKFEPLWDLAIRSKRVVHALPLLDRPDRLRPAPATGRACPGPARRPARGTTCQDHLEPEERQRHGHGTNDPARSRAPLIPAQSRDRTHESQGKAGSDDVCRRPM